MISTFIKRPVFTTMLVLLLVVFGVTAYPTLGIDLYPDVEFPIVTVNVTYQGASPEEMESLITKPIEDAVSSVAGIKTLSSISREGYTQITLEFELGTNPKMAANDVREKVAGVRKRLPDAIDEPVVQRFDITAQSIMTYSLASDARSRHDTRKLAIDIVKDELQKIDGVADVAVVGSSDREIHIFIDPKKLDSYNISFQKVFDAVNGQNVNTPGGHVATSAMELTVRTMGKYQSVDDIKQIIVDSQPNRLVRLSDVVDVSDGWAEERTYARTNGVPSVLVIIQKQSGTNTVAVADKVVKAMDHLQKDVLPSDIKITATRDRAKYIRDSVEDVMISLVFGGFLAVLITFLFLRNTRATLIGAIAIPTSVISTFFLMKVMHFTLNNMSLMGLSLAVGILIDDAIVIIENIYRHMELGKSPMEAAREGTSEISLAVMATTFSILAVFVPIGNMGEIVGQFFKEFGLTIAFAVGFSLLVAFTLTPTLSAYWLKMSDNKPSVFAPIRGVQKLLDTWEAGFIGLRNFYEVILRWALQRPKKLVAIAVISLFLNFLLVPFLGVEFQPTYDSGEFTISLSAPAGTSMDKMVELVTPVEAEVNNIPELYSAYMMIGASRQPIYKANIGVRLVDSSQRDRSMMQIMDEVRMKFRDIPGLKVTVSSNQGQGRGDSRPIQVGLRGDDLTLLNGYAEEVADKIKQIPGTTDVDISSEQYEPEIQIKLDASRMGDIGIDPIVAGNVIQMAFLGLTTNHQYNIADSDYNIRVQLSPEHRLTMNDVANLRVTTKGGSFVRLGDIASVKLSSGPTQIDREDRQRQVIVYANSIGTSPGEVISQLKQFLPSIQMPLGYSYKFVGQADAMARAFGEISKALTLAVVLIYMVLAAEFESFVQPLIIMLSLPFSLMGAILGLLVSAHTINMMSLIGVIMLMGLVTKNAILLVDYTNQLRSQGTETRDALIQAGIRRLRPILMTTLAMIFGMMPIALGIGAGAEIRSSMGVALIGGLITSTFLTLIVVPLVYLLFEQVKTFIRDLKSGEHPPNIEFKLSGNMSSPKNKKL